MDMAVNDIMAPSSVNAANCQYSTRYCWEAEKVKSLIRLRAELSPLFTGKRNASKYAWAVVERELNVPLPLSKIIKKWNNLLQEYKAIKMSEEPKRREWPFFTLMDVYFSDQVNDPSLRLFSSTKTLKETIDDSVFEDDPIIASAIAAATSGAYMNIDELIRRQKERAANEKKFSAMSDYKYDIKPMLSNNKFNNSEAIKLSKSVDDLSMQQYKIKDELLRQREQEAQENLAKLKQQARQHHQQQQQQAAAQQQAVQQQRFIQQHQQAAAAAAAQHQAAQQHHGHLMPQTAPTPPPPPTPSSLHAALQQQQQNILHHHQQQQQQQHQQQQQQQHQQQQQQLQQEQQRRREQQMHHASPHSSTPQTSPTQHHHNAHSRQASPPTPSPSTPTTAQQIHLQTAQHQAAQQHLQSQQQKQPFTDPNTIDQYLLSWNNFHGNMCRGFHSLQKDEKMVDVTIAAGGKIFKAHKLVLSVCSPYFQQIFLENPSSHPILLMADVEASHMAGLLDFMYSGQVNVKYEDLPVFLKVAEAMKIKGLHTEKNMDDDNKDSCSTNDNDSTAECHFERGTHSVNITGQGFEPRKSLLDSHTLNGIASLNNGRDSPQQFSSFRDHIKSKASLAETFMKNISRNNNNSITTNYNHVPASINSIGEPLNKDNFSLLQASSKKLMDSARKHHKYLAKRKILMHYNDELNEKRLKEYERYGMEQQDTNNNNNSELSISESTPIPVTQTHNNFKIRLMENHLKANQEQLQKQQEMEMETNSNHHPQTNANVAAAAAATANDDEEEALNLVQNNTHEQYHKGHSTSTNRTSESSDSVMETEHLDVDQTSESDVASTTNVEVGSQIRDEDDINNNNTVKQEFMELDDNNNSNLKNIALINAINRNVEHSKVHEYPRHNNLAANDDTGRRTPQTESHTETSQQAKQHHHHHHHHESEEDNNNNHLQLDLSAVKSIATAEILCGLKSKVFKMEALEASENSPATAIERQQTNRTLSEIKNAD
ncbi:uncharacterized protein LOC142221156 [Haematobia irritans]|uniref:uncharacterized protein LOC142221156 n=1 Tax=Haematobia irritans TaxID=7368 RepID=UPI003F50CFEE